MQNQHEMNEKFPSLYRTVKIGYNGGNMIPSVSFWRTADMQALTILKKFFSVDMVIYAAIVIVAATALLRCTLPLSRVAAKLRRAARTIVTESKQNKEKKSWNDMHFLGDSLSATWADFLQNAEMRDAHGETCDVTQYINEDTVIYALGSTGFAGLAPGVMTSLGILGTFLGLVMACPA